MANYNKAVSPNEINPHIRGTKITMDTLLKSYEYKDVRDLVRLTKGYAESKMLKEAQKTAARCVGKITHLRLKAEVAEDSTYDVKDPSPSPPNHDSNSGFSHHKVGESKKADFLKILNDYEKDVSKYIGSMHINGMTDDAPARNHSHRIDKGNIPIPLDLETDFLDSNVVKWLKEKTDKSITEIDEKLTEYLSEQLQSFKKSLLGISDTLEGTISNPIILTSLSDGVYRVKGNFKVAEDSGQIVDGNSTSFIFVDTTQDPPTITRMSSSNVYKYTITDEKVFTETYATVEWVESKGYIDSATAEAMIKDYIENNIDQIVKSIIDNKFVAATEDEINDLFRTI